MACKYCRRLWIVIWILFMTSVLSILGWDLSARRMARMMDAFGIVSVRAGESVTTKHDSGVEVTVSVGEARQ